MNNYLLPTTDSQVKLKFRTNSHQTHSMQLFSKTSTTNDFEFSTYGIVKAEKFLKNLLKLFLMLPTHNQSRDENPILS